MRTYFKFFFVLSFILVVSCNTATDDDTCITTKTEYVSLVTAPSTGTVNQSITFPINFYVFNGCGGFNQFIETQDGSTKTIEVEAIYDGCICTFDIPLITVNYTFTPTTTGTYILRFKSSPTDFITATITIN